MMLVGRPDDEVAVVDDGVVSLSMKDTCSGRPRCRCGDVLISGAYAMRQGVPRALAVWALYPLVSWPA